MDSAHDAVDGWNQVVAESIEQTDSLGVAAAKTAQDVEETVGKAVEAATKAKDALKGVQGGGTGAPAPAPEPVATGGGGGAAAAKQIEQILNARIQSVLVRAKAVMETELAVLSDAYDKGLIAVQEYYDIKSELLEKDYQAEVKAINDKMAIETNAAQVLQLQDDIFIKQQEHQRALLSLAKERAEAEKQVAENRERIANMLRDMAIENMDTTSIAGQQAQEKAQFEAAWADKLQTLSDAKIQEDELLEFYHQKDLARQKLAAEQDIRLLESRLATAKEIAGGMATTFEELYELTGEQAKEFFYLAKAAAIAKRP